MVNGFSYDIAQVQTPGGRITRLTYPYTRTYRYDANGNPSGIEIAAAPWQGRRFDYDNVNRLPGAMGDFGFIDLTYDNTGNRLTHTHNGAESVYSYVPGTNRLDAITPAGGSPIQYSYDGHGNTTAVGSRTYTYNAENRLTGISDSELSAQYVYNGLGQRVIKTVDGQSTFYHYDLNGKMIAETPGDDSTHQGTEHIFKGNGLLARVDVAGGAIYSYHTNYLGAVHQLVDSNDTVVWEAVYKPFGQAAVNAASTVVNNWRLPGQYYDEESGLYYNYYRYYNPAIGRYMTPDPIGLEGGINRYAYVSNNPVNAVDPFGLEIRELNQGERIVIDSAINQIKSYGYSKEADNIKYLLSTNKIKIDTELSKSGKLGEAGKFFTWIHLSGDLLGKDLGLDIVPALAHEYAHIASESRYIFPLDTFILHGLGNLFGIYDYEEVPDKVYDLMLEEWLRTQKEWLTNQNCD